LSSQQPGEGLTWYSVVLGENKDLPTARRAAAQFERDHGLQPEIISWVAAPAAAATAGAPVPARR
jgi:hypothetical protein